MPNLGQLTPLRLTALSQRHISKPQQISNQVFRLLAVIDGECWVTCADGVEIHLLGSRVGLLQNIPPYKIAFASPDTKVRQLDFVVDSTAEALYPAKAFFEQYGFAKQLSQEAAFCYVFEDAYGIVPVTLDTLSTLCQGDTFPQPMGELALTGMLACLFQGVQQPSSANIHLATALSYIHQNYMNNIGAADIAAYTGIHINYLHRLFIQKTGHRLLAYITNYRLKKAQMMLITTNWTVAQIAQASGFSSRSYFGKVFVKSMGISPLAFRKSYDVTCDYTARDQSQASHNLLGGEPL